MTHETHRSSVHGCPNLAAHRVSLYDFDSVGGAVRFGADETCPHLCLEHAADNEQQARGPHEQVTYPHTDQGRERGVTIYLDLSAVDV